MGSLASFTSSAGGLMNHDHIIIASLALGGLIGFLLGYSQGHDHGKIAGRIAYRKSQRQLEQVGR